MRWRNVRFGICARLSPALPRWRPVHRTTARDGWRDGFASCSCSCARRRPTTAGSACATRSTRRAGRRRAARGARRRPSSWRRSRTARSRCCPDGLKRSAWMPPAALAPLDGAPAQAALRAQRARARAARQAACARGRRGRRQARARARRRAAAAPGWARVRLAMARHPARVRRARRRLGEALLDHDARRRRHRRPLCHLRRAAAHPARRGATRRGRRRPLLRLRLHPAGLRAAHQPQLALAALRGAERAPLPPLRGASAIARLA